MCASPGGEALEASTSAAKQAAAEASTGAWLRELEEALAAGEPPPRVSAPGLPRGAFGAWAMPDAGRPPGTPHVKASHPSAKHGSDHNGCDKLSKGSGLQVGSQDPLNGARVDECRCKCHAHSTSI